MAFKKEDFANDPEFLVFCTELVKPLEAANTGLKTDINKLKTQAKLFEGVNIDELKQAKIDLEKIKMEKQTNETELEKAMRIQKETHENELKGIKTMLTTLQTQNRVLIVDDAIKNELIKINCNPVLMQAAIMAVKPLVSVIMENNIEVAKIGDKTIEQYMESWQNSDVGKHFCLARRNSGNNTNAIDQQTVDENKKFFDKKSKEYNRTKQMEIKKKNPELYNNLLKMFS